MLKSKIKKLDGRLFYSIYNWKTLVISTRYQCINYKVIVNQVKQLVKCLMMQSTEDNIHVDSLQDDF